nr:hypothetical protein [Tanacetum cinerariifolium]
MDGWKTRALKNKSFVDIQDSFNKTMKRVNMFVDMDTEVVESTKKEKVETVQESSSKRAGDELEQENLRSRRWNNSFNLGRLFFHLVLSLLSNSYLIPAAHAVPALVLDVALLDRCFWKYERLGIPPVLALLLLLRVIRSFEQIREEKLFLDFQSI